MLDPQIKFATTHTWARPSQTPNEFIIGISDFAQRALGDIVFIETPKIGQILNAGEVAGLAESVKTASDIYSPLTGTVTEINTALEDDPETVNDDAYNTGWIFKLQVADANEYAQLLNHDAYISQNT